MDYKEQQEQELEALEAIYPEEELTIEGRQWPNIRLSLELKSNQFEDPTDDDFEVTLNIKLTEKYPDEIPEISIEGIEFFSEDRVEAIVEKMKEVATENLGMVMVFTIVSALQDEMGVLLDEKKQETDVRVEAEKEAKEAESRKKFEGTIVTPESFRKWKEMFDAERRAAIEKAEKERQAALAGRLSGRELFLRDATLSLSDVALIGESAEVAIDESLFDNEELEGLELDDVDSDED